MLREGHLSVEVEVEVTFSGASTGGPAATPPAMRSGVGFVVAVVGGNIMSRVSVLCREDSSLCLVRTEVRSGL